MGKFVDRTGLQYGCLTVIKVAERATRHRSVKWECYCNPEFGGCGNRKVVAGDSLQGGKTVSCGCWGRKQGSINGKNGSTHGRSRTRLYTIWGSMLQRCLNPNHYAYPEYGGRGITIEDPRWLEFENWLEDIADIPEGLTLDRIDNNRGYCKDNCRLVTQKEQCRNTRRNRLIKWNGEVKCAAEWAEVIGINYQTFYTRLKLMDKGEMTLDEVFNLPYRYKKR